MNLISFLCISALCISYLTTYKLILKGFKVLFSHNPISKSYGLTLRPRIVNLIIYNESSEYERQMQSELQRLFNGAKYGSYTKQLFISCKPTLTDVTHESGHMLYIKCSESYIPGILHKTIEAMQYCMQTYEFDILIRSNISTVIDFHRLQIHPTYDFFYGSSYVWNRSEPDKSFASGTNIILNRRAVEYLIANLDYTQIKTPDDVAIGDVLSRVTIPYQMPVKMIWNYDDPNGVVFRNRDEKDDRTKDVTRMASIVDRLLTSYMDK